MRQASTHVETSRYVASLRAQKVEKAQKAEKDTKETDEPVESTGSERRLRRQEDGGDVGPGKRGQHGIGAEAGHASCNIASLRVGRAAHLERVRGAWQPLAVNYDATRRGAGLRF